METSTLHRWLETSEVETTVETTVETSFGDKDALTKFSIIMSNILLFFLIFGLSASVRVQELRHHLTNRKAIFMGVTMQFLVMPFLGYVAVMAFRNQGLTEAMGITLLVVTSSPGGSYSNWWCNLFNAELALSVAMTSVSSILSLGFLPANLFFYSWLAYSVGAGESGGDLNIIDQIDFKGIFISLGVVLSAILSGLFVGYKSVSPTFHDYANHFGSFCGISLIIFSAALGGGAGDADTNFWSLPWSFYLATLLPCIGGVTIATLLSRCSRLLPSEVVTISIECCYQNVAIATSVAITMFSDPNERAEAISVPLFYGVIEGIIVGLYCVLSWKMDWTRAPADEKLCVVITKNYQTGEEDEDHDVVTELPKNWVKRLFVPKNVESELRNVDGVDKVDEMMNDEEMPRERAESSDVTVSTSTQSPPGTPQTDDGKSQRNAEVEIEVEYGSHLFDTPKKTG